MTMDAASRRPLEGEDEQSDERCIEGLLAGNETVLREVRNWIRLAASKYRSLLRSELEDLEQQALLDLVIALREGRFRAESSLRSYVRRLIHHKCIDHLRASRVRRHVDLERLELPSRVVSAFEALRRRESTQLLLAVLRDMPESCRELWRMIHDGLSYKEMGRRLGIADGTLRVRVLRCRRKAAEARERLLAGSGGNESTAEPT